MTMRLFVDDFRECPSGWHVARSISEAIFWLARGVVVEVSLDHDICSYRYRNKSIRETFMPVAEYLALMSNRPLVRIHTANVVAGAQMADVLGISYNNEIYDPENYG